MKYCKRCVYPMVSAVPLTFDDDGICSGCKVNDQQASVDWSARKKMLHDLLDEQRRVKTTPYDCLIPVSGGKDSWHQVNTITQMGFNPLLVTYDANQWTEPGRRNLIKMREVFGCDHVVFTPSTRVLKALNRVCMEVMGDPSWEAHAGIYTLPFREAVLRRIPIVIFGEHGYMNLGGMHSYNDMVEHTYRFRLEHAMRGYEWNDILLLAQERGEELTTDDMTPWQYPSDDQLDDVGVRGIFISNYCGWKALEHGPAMVKLGFEPAPEGMFQRTFETLSNLDDVRENGLHDFLKYVKLGYGRATDHACRAIRSGRLTREQGIIEVLKRDHVVPQDLGPWLEYVGWTREYFDQVCDSFRDKRVWWRDESGNWCKDNIV